MLAPADDENLVLSVPKAAQLLGMHPHTLRKAIREGRIKAAAVGRVHKLSRSELARYWKSVGGGNLFASPGTVH